MNQIRICGAGGQGILLAGILLGQAGMLDKKYSAQASSYGAEARGSACRSEVILSDEWIAFPHVVKTDILVALSQQGYDTYRADMGDTGGMVFHDRDMVKPSEGDRLPHFAVPAAEIALDRLGRRVVTNMVMLGAVAAATGVVTRLSLEDAVRLTIAPGAHDLNLKALDAGFELGGRLNE